VDEGGSRARRAPRVRVDTEAHALE